MIIGIILILLTVGLSGCNEKSKPLVSDKDKFIGTWTNHTTSSFYEIPVITDITFIFFSDGKVNLTIGISSLDNSYSDSTSFDERYEIKDGKLVLTTTNETLIYNYSFLDNNTKLILTLEGKKDAVVYTKEKKL